MSHLPEDFMHLALVEGRKALPACLPNPPVGCVLVKDGKVIASGAPEEIRNEIVASPAPSEVVVAWLLELGYDASFGKVDPFRRKARRDRQADAD